MVKCGEHSDLKPWEDGYAAVKRQLGEWTVTIEGWEDAYVSWLHDALIKVRVMDDVDNALNSGAELLARWAETPDTGLTARDRKTLEKAAETMADQTLSAEDRLAAGDNPTIAALHEAGLDCKIMVGGAVMTPEYAEEIGADYYSKDAQGAVAIAKEVLG